eukprot:3439525-Pyramimonas_sp.AAC.1
MQTRNMDTAGNVSERRCAPSGPGGRKGAHRNQIAQPVCFFPPVSAPSVRPNNVLRSSALRRTAPRRPCSFRSEN